MSEQSLPFGFDRADGLSSGNANPYAGVTLTQPRLGTPTPAGAVEHQEDAGYFGEIPFEELPDSPEIERAEQCTITKRYRGSWETLMNYLPTLGRWNILYDSYGHIWHILSSKIQHERGDTGLLTIVAESVTFDTPPDNFQIIPVELGVNILKHPRYFYALSGTGDDYYLNQYVIRLLQNYFENPTAAYRDSLTTQLVTSVSPGGNNAYKGTVVDGVVSPYQTKIRWTEISPATGTSITKEAYPVPGTDMAKRAAAEIIQKYWRGEETPYMTGYQITWSQYYFWPPRLNPGGYVVSPENDMPPLNPFFTDTEDGGNIFDEFVDRCPANFSSDGTYNGTLEISWLRKADECVFERTWFKLTRTWIGSPIGYWDLDLFSGDERPQDYRDYRFTSPAQLPPVTTQNA